VSWWRRPSTSSFAGSARRLVADLLSAQYFSGAVVVARHGEVLAQAFAGLADRAAGRKVTAETRFGVASVSKMFIAAAIARLADRGLVTFGAPVQDVLPKDWYPAGLNPRVTVHNLLTHTSGLPDYLPDEDPMTPDLWQSMGIPAMRRATDFLPILNALPAGAGPSQVAVYCNAGYLVAGLILEAAAVKPFATATEDEIFGACDMHDTAFLPFDELGPEVSVGFVPPGASDAAWRTNIDLLPFAGAPDGGAFSTSRDLLSFLLALHGGGLLTPDTTRAVLTRWATDAGGTGFGYGQRIIERGGRTWFGHTGEDHGASARAFHSPADGVSLIVLSNLTDGAGGVFRQLIDSLPTAGLE
jgi:CubicO group peptidase (beta-lactamase class C family)